MPPLPPGDRNVSPVRPLPQPPAADRATDCSADCGCHSAAAVGRREFLMLSGVGAAASLAAAAGMPIMAGPFEQTGGFGPEREQEHANDYARLIPADKKLAPAWVQTLFARGEPTIYRGDALDRMGMPVGGVGAGQMYLSGDGRLWLWDVFNRVTRGVENKGQNGENYVTPLKAVSSVEQGFAIRVTPAAAADAGAQNRPQIRALDRSGWADVSFRGEYPIGRVEYRDAASPVVVSLEAFSPFVPLNARDSSWPATVLQFTVKNVSDAPIQIELAGWLQNAVCKDNGRADLCARRNRVLRLKQRAARPETARVALLDVNLTMLECSAEEPPRAEEKPPRPDILIDDFEKPAYEGWTATGTAFGDGPIEAAKMPRYQGDVGAQGARLVNTHNTRQSEDMGGGDAHVGTLTCKPFVLERDYLTFLIGGGAHAGETCLNLLIDGQVMRTATGRNDNRLAPHSFDVREFAGKTATLQIVDDEKGGWGNIGVDDLRQSDRPRFEPVTLGELPDFGTLALALLGENVAGAAEIGLKTGPGKPVRESLETLFAAFDAGDVSETARKPFGDVLIGGLKRAAPLAPGQEETFTFFVSWHFPNLRLPGFKGAVRRYYATRFESATAVAAQLAARFDELAAQTRLWRDTWYDSTLPHWFLDRTFANTSTLATSTFFRFANGRYYGWEGVGCCEGTCTHVWHYAQAVARIFPEIERDLRERVDYGISFKPDTGLIAYRGEMHNEDAHDGQAGTILRAYREHQMSPDDAFLRRNWPKIRKSLEFLIARDGDGDGIIEGPQSNTLDAAWYGRIAWLASLYLAALRAGEAMAEEMDDAAFAAQTRAILEKSRAAILRLYNGEFFIQVPDPAHLDAIGADAGCYIDQVFGQSWAFQVGLGRLYSEVHVKSALRALWKYNFAPDVGPFRKEFKEGRPYALAGDAGLIMCTWPKGGQREDWKKHWQYGYFNECMSGFEHQVAGHMLWEGLLTEGLAIERAIHDRYDARLRNPYNEIECGDHYARAMASYGVFLAACGYEYHGPKGQLAFSPRLSPENFRAAFTAAEGWGTLSQTQARDCQTNAVALKFGRLRVRTLAFDLPAGAAPAKIRVACVGRDVPAQFEWDGRRVRIALRMETIVQAGETLTTDTGFL